LFYEVDDLVVDLSIYPTKVGSSQSTVGSQQLLYMHSKQRAR